MGKQALAKVVACGQQAGVRLDRLLELGDGRVGLPLGTQRHAEIVVRLGIRWPQLQCRFVLHNGLCQCARACRALPRLLCASA